MPTVTLQSGAAKVCGIILFDAAAVVGDDGCGWSCLVWQVFVAAVSGSAPIASCLENRSLEREICLLITAVLVTVLRTLRRFLE